MQIEPKLNFYRRSPLINRTMEKRLGVYTIQERIMVVFGIFTAMMGFIYPLFGVQIKKILETQPDSLISYAIGLSGLFMLLLVYFKGKQR